MAVAGDLVVGINGDTTGLQRATGRATKNIGSFASRAVSSLGKIGLAAGGVRVIVNSLKSILGTPIKLAMEVEQAQVAFETMLGSAAAATKVLQDLSDFSAATPFQLPDLRDAARLLLANKLPAQDLIKTMKVLGDISSGTGTRIIELTRIFNKMRATGRVSLENINELMLRNIPIWDLLADKLGISKDEIRKMASAGRLGFGTINEVLTELTESGGLFADSMAKQSKTLGGLWSTLQDNLSLLLGTIGTQIAETFDLKKATGNITRIMAVSKKWVKENREVVKMLALVLAAGVALAIMIPIIFAIKAAFIALGVVAGVVASPIYLVIAAVAALSLVVIGLTGNWDTMFAAAKFGFKNIGIIIDLMIAKLELLGENISTIASNIKNLRSPLKGVKSTNAKIVGLTIKLIRKQFEGPKKTPLPEIPSVKMPKISDTPLGIPTQQAATTGAQKGSAAFFDRIAALTQKNRQDEMVTEQQQTNAILMRIDKKTAERKPINDFAGLRGT